MPNPVDFVVKNGSKIRSASPAESPGPESLTAIRTPAGSAALVPIDIMRDPSVAVFIASIAFMIKFRITCCNWILSANMCGRSSESTILSETLCSDRTTRVSPTISKTTLLMSNSSDRAGAFLENSRMRLPLRRAPSFPPTQSRITAARQHHSFPEVPSR